ncbi:MAG: hypothetical protein ACPGF7_15050 [Pontibacterium sp.]
MKLIIHRVAAITAFLCIVTFFVSTAIVEVWGTLETVAKIKSYIVYPGLFILIPSIALAGGTGFSLAKKRNGNAVARKKKRMPLIALNGLFILLPAAITLNIWAAQGIFDAAFYGVQALELIAGATNITLMIFSIRDGRKMTARK